MADTLAMMEDKENLAPAKAAEMLSESSLSPKKPAGGRKGRSKSIGPGGLNERAENLMKDSRQEAKNRRKSAYVPNTKAIISADAEKAARQAARRKTLANRRVSFAPEATLHTWDVVEFMRDQTTSTDSSSDTRRGSNITGASTASPDAEDRDLLSSSASRAPQTKNRRSSGIPPMNFNNPDDAPSSSGMSGSSDESGSEDEQEDDDEGSQDGTGTAMSLDIDDRTLLSQSSEGTSSSTGSSERLEASLRLAAQQAGTRGIDYDEHGEGDMEDDVSMELAEDGITNAFQPWAAQAAHQQHLEAATLDQENVNPFSPAFKADMMSTIEEEETGDMSMDVTKAMGGILRGELDEAEISSLGDGIMEMTQAVGRICGNDSGSSPIMRGTQKRRRPTSQAGSPGETVSAMPTKRRRSSTAYSSMGDHTMDLTVALGGIESTASLAKPERRRSMRHRSSGVTSAQEDLSMEFTQAVGSIKNIIPSDHTTSSFDENEELTMELTTVLGGITELQSFSDSRPVTPQMSPSPVRNPAKPTPKDQERFKDVPNPMPKKLLTPLLEKQIPLSMEKPVSANSGSGLSSPTKRRSSRSSLPVPELVESIVFAPQSTGPAERQTRIDSLRSSPHQDGLHSSLRTIETNVSPTRIVTTRTLRRSPVPIFVPPASELNVQDQLDAQFRKAPPQAEHSPTAAKQLRSSPMKPTATSSPHVAMQQNSPPRRITPTVSRSETPQRFSAAEPTTPSPAVGGQLHRSPAKAVTTPDQRDEIRTIADSLRLMNTPRKETLKNMTPRKQTQPKEESPRKIATPRSRSTRMPLGVRKDSPARQLVEDLAKYGTEGQSNEKMHLQAFLEMAQIRFMELTTTKRRMTTIPTPSKIRTDGAMAMEIEISLENAVVAGACTTPELEMFRHACHELKHYISDGKKVIKQLENETHRKTPPLLRAYQQAHQDPASHERKQALDSQMRDMKTHARFRSKELWYAWRTQLLEDLVKALSSVAEGLIKDDELLQHAEQIVEETLPSLLEQRQILSVEADHLEQVTAVDSEEDKVELHVTRERLIKVDEEVQQKQKLLEELRQKAAAQAQSIFHMEETKAEFGAAVQEAERMREACRGVSLQEIAALEESTTNLEETYGWSITSAESSPSNVTMTYKSQLQLFFHPSSFNVVAEQSRHTRPNAPIRLSYIAQDREQRPKELTTTLRFFHQLLRSSLQALSQCTTRVPDLLNLISGGWDTALAVAEAERRLDLEALTSSRIVSDERLAIESLVLLPTVRTKVRVVFELLAGVGGDGTEDAGLALNLTIEPSTKIVYGEPYNEGKMAKAIVEQINGIEKWDVAVKGLKEHLIVHGAKKGGRR